MNMETYVFLITCICWTLCSPNFTMSLNLWAILFVSNSILHMTIINYLMDTSILAESTFVPVIHL